MVVTQVPARRSSAAVADRLSLEARYPEGSRIIVVPPGGDVGEIRLLSTEFAAAGAPDVSPQADSVLFAGRKENDSGWGIFEVGVGNGEPQKLVDMERDCTDPTYLAGNRLLFVCGDDATGTSDGGAATTWSLYTASRDGSEVERITFGPGSAFDPTPLQDGRILFSMWQAPGPGRPDGAATALFTVNPDGTLLDAFTGSHRPPALKVRPRQTRDGGVVFMAVDRRGKAPRIERVEMSRPQAGPTTILPAQPQGSTSSTSLAFRPGAVEPLPGGGLLVAGLPGPEVGAAGRTWGIFRLPRGKRGVEQVFDDPGWDEVEAVPLIPMPPPRGRPRVSDGNRSTGTVLCYDAARSDGLVKPQKGLRPAAVVIQTVGTKSARAPAQGSDGSGSGGSSDLDVAALGGGVELGRVEVESDSSFFVEVPADVPIRVQTLDGDGLEIATSAWFWVRPGEVRACFGCHESRAAAPVNRPVEAIDRPAQRLELATQNTEL